jgi:hypothetical protein
MDQPYPLSLGSIVQVSSRQASTQLDGEVMILGMDAGEYFSLTDVGSRIWELLQSPIRVQDLCSRLQAEYAVAPSQCEPEVCSLLANLAEAGLIEIHSGTSS